MAVDAGRPVAEIGRQVGLSRRQHHGQRVVGRRQCIVDGQAGFIDIDDVGAPEQAGEEIEAIGIRGLRGHHRLPRIRNPVAVGILDQVDVDTGQASLRPAILDAIPVQVLPDEITDPTIERGRVGGRPCCDVVGCRCRIQDLADARGQVSEAVDEHLEGDLERSADRKRAARVEHTPRSVEGIGRSGAIVGNRRNDPQRILEEGAVRHVRGVGRQRIGQQEVADRRPADVVDHDREQDLVARAHEPVAIVVQAQGAVLADLERRQRGDGRADIQAGRGGAGGQGILPPRGGQLHARGQHVQQHARLVAIVGVIHLGAIQFAQADRDVVPVPVGIGERPRGGVGIVIHVDRDGRVAVPDRRHPHGVAVLRRIGTGRGIPADAEADENLRREGIAGHQGEAPVPRAVAAAAVGAGGIDRGQGIELGPRRGKELGRESVRHDLLQVATHGPARHREAVGRDRVAAGTRPGDVTDGDGTGGGVVQPDGRPRARDALGRAGSRDRAVVAVRPEGGRHQAEEVALVVLVDVAGDQIHLHGAVRENSGPDLDISVHQPRRTLVQGHRGFKGAVGVRIDLNGRPALAGHDGQPGVLEDLVVHRIGHVDTDRNPEVCSPVRRVEDLVRAGQQSVGAGRPAAAGDRNGLGRRDLVAAVEIDHRVPRRRRDRVAQDDHGAGGQEVGGEAGRCAIGRVAIPPDLGAARIAGAVQVRRIRDVRIESVFVVVVVDDGAVGEDGDRHVGPHGIDGISARPVGDGLEGRQDVVLRHRHMEVLHRRGIRRPGLQAKAAGQRQGHPEGPSLVATVALTRASPRHVQTAHDD